ncbi:MAG: response regulator [Candidatus Andersenbacteria bacterium]
MSKKKVWIVDDDDGISEAFSLILHEEGYEPGALASGWELNKKLQAEQPDIIFLDLTLAGEDGQSIARELKRNPTTQDIPVVVLSAAPDIAALAKQCGADDFLAKPCAIEEVLEKIKQYT